MDTNTKKILADGRWAGRHGIGRFASEILTRLKNTNLIQSGPRPISIPSIVWQSYHLSRQSDCKVFFTPGFNPVFSSIPYVLTIHDLIHLEFPQETSLGKKLFYHTFIKQSARKAFKILTVSEFSRQTILNWSQLPDENVVVVGNGVSEQFKPEGFSYQPGFPYLLSVGNTKEHKNLKRIVQAFAQARIDDSIHLICTSPLHRDVLSIIRKNKLQNRIHSHPGLSDQQLAEYYRGSLGLVFPSLYEGFGLPVIESMACGVPVLTSNITSLPEIAGNAAILVDPYRIESISHGLEELVNNTSLRHDLTQKGISRAQMFSWEKTATHIQTILDSVV